MTEPAPASTILDAGLAIAARGLLVAWCYGIRETDGLCQCGDAHETSRSSMGKHPIGKAWQRRATSDSQALRNAYATGNNVGIVCGEQPDGRFLVCIDEDDEEVFTELVAQLGALPETLSGRSPRGRRLFYYAHEEIKNHALGGVDIRGTGGFVVVGPSRHYTGAFYTEIAGELAELPNAWLARFRPKPKIPQSLTSWEPSDNRARPTLHVRQERAVITFDEIVAIARPAAMGAPLMRVFIPGVRNPHNAF